MESLEKAARLILIGCGGHARSVADVALDAFPGLEIRFVDRAARPGEKIFGFPVSADWEAADAALHIALGDNTMRREAFARHAAHPMVSVIARSARLGRDCGVGRGCFLAHGCHLGPLASVGTGTLVNTQAVLDHEVRVGDFCHIGPHATVSGRTVIGNGVFLGAGSTVIDGIRIGDDIVVGAGSTVIGDLLAPGVYVGSPARPVRSG